MNDLNFTHAVTIGSRKFTFVGRSRAADVTALFVPELSIGLDVGENFFGGTGVHEACFITHAHADHAFGCGRCVSRRRQPRFFIPAQYVALLDNFLLRGQELTNGEPFADPDKDFECNHKTIGVSPGDTFELNQTISVRVFEMTHSQPCCGFGFFERKRKLKAEFRDLPGKEIAALRATGVDVSDTIEEPLFVFCGDTTAEMFDKSPAVLEFSVVIVECTFIDEEDYLQAQKTKHMHWRDLKEKVVAHPAVTFILIHFSLRYTKDYIHAHFRSQGLPNVVVFLSE